MKTAGGFEQCYNAQAQVDTDSMLIVGSTVTQACNDKQQIRPMLAVLAAHPNAVGMPEQLLADTGYFSVANVAALVNIDVCGPSYAPSGQTPVTYASVARVKSFR